MTKCGGWLQAFAAFSAGIYVSFILVTAASGSSADWRASGNEPFWSLSRSGGEMTLETEFGANRVSFSAPYAKHIDDQTVVYATSIGNDPLEVTVRTELCVDTMTGMPRPEQVTIVLGAKRLGGCGGDPASLLHGREWSVDSLARRPVLAEPRISMLFAANGELSGLGSCNRFNAKYTISGEGLAIGKGMSSMMACEEPIMQQEQLFLELLERVSRFSIAADGALILHSDQERTITARRP
jgi:heat shock protein HslJ